MQLNPEGAYESLRQEEISYAYIHAIAAASGYDVEFKRRIADNGGIDVSIEAPGAVEDFMAPGIDAQVKCTYQDCIKNGEITHSLKAKNFNRLAHPNTQRPAILIVVLVDRDILKWIRHGKKLDRRLTLIKASAYWLSIRGHELIEASKEKCVKIPIFNRLTSESLMRLMAKVAKKEEL